MNITSIVLGLVSLAFAVHALRVRGCLICCTGSLLSCALALVCQLGEVYRLTLLEDAAAIYDTAHARLLAACWLVGLTGGMHLWALILGKKQKCGDC